MGGRAKCSCKICKHHQRVSGRPENIKQQNQNNKKEGMELLRSLKIFLLVTMIFSLTACSNATKKPTPKATIPKEPTSKAQEKTGIKVDKEPVITLYINETGKKSSIAMEKYLEGVVAAEMDVKWPPEALAAQAILARTFTMKKISQGGVKAKGTDASTSVEEFQAYAPEKINNAVKAAVHNTRGKVVLYNNQYINAWFYSCSGGKTASSAAEGLEYKQEKAPYIKSVSDPGLAAAPPNIKEWRTEISLSEVKNAVQKAKGTDPGSIKSASIAAKGPSGIATKLKFNNATVSAAAFRLAVGSERMRSASLKEFAIKGDKLLITGKGFGHGVGMSQWGAKALADQGMKADQIINHYYKDIKIKKIWK